MRRSISLGLVLFTAFFVRGFPFFQYSYPTGADYGHHTLFADLYLREGRLPEYFPYYQLGRARWSNMPGGALVYSLLSAASGRSAFELAALTSLFSIIEISGVYLLAMRVFRRFDAAIAAALVCGLIPAAATMPAWSAYANIIALAFMPYAFIAWLDYWESPGSRRLLVAAICICGVASIHHLSTIWLGLTLLLFCLGLGIADPKETARRAFPLAIAGLAFGFPVLLRLYELFHLFGSAELPLGVDPYFEARVDWNDWVQLASAASVVFLTAGMASLLHHKEILLKHRLLIASYLLVSLVFIFGWRFGFRWYYARGVYFLSIPIAFGAASLFLLWPGRWPRLLVSMSLVASLGVGTVLRAEAAARYYEAVSPSVLEGVEWLREFSSAEDVVVAGGFLGFHLPRLLERPLLVALSRDLIGNPDDTETASAALSILLGLHDADDALERWNVRFVVVRARGEDVPDPYRSRAVLTDRPRLVLLFANSDLLVYGVKR